MLVRPADRADLVRVFELATHFEVPICVLGGGFNTLVRDEGIRGIVVHLGALRKVHLDGHIMAGTMIPSLEMYGGRNPNAWFGPWISDAILGLLAPVMIYLVLKKRGLRI